MTGKKLFIIFGYAKPLIEKTSYKLTQFLKNMQKTIALVSSLATLVLLGAGCAGLAAMPSLNKQTQSTSTADIPDPITYPVTLSATAESTSLGTVVVKWQKPETVAAGTSFRVLYGAKPEPMLPSAYWYERSSGNAVEAEINGVPSGKKYFRVCEFKNNACVSYSNTLEVNVE